MKRTHYFTLCFLLLLPVFGSAQAPGHFQTLIASDSSGHAMFGHRVEINSKHLIVSAWRNEKGLTGQNDVFRAGMVYSYEMENGKWKEKQKLVAPERKPNMLFGSDLVLQDTMLFVASFNAPSKQGLGEVYVYHFNKQKGWEYMQTLSAPDSSTYFGWSIDVEGNHLLVGAAADSRGLGDTTITVSGAVYHFKLKNDSWEYAQKMVAPVRSAYAQFGCDISMDDSLAVIGSYGFNDHRGSAYVFAMDKTEQWTVRQTLGYSMLDKDDWFGNDVIINGDQILVGVMGFEHQGAPPWPTNAGMVVAYEKNGNEWKLDDLMSEPQRKKDAEYGAAFAFRGKQMLITSQGNNSNLAGDDYLDNSGALYILGDTLGNMSQAWKVVSPHRKVNSGFGGSLATYGEYVVVGAKTDYANTSENSSGRVYVYKFGHIGISDSQVPIKFTLYPNPSKGNIQVLAPRWIDKPKLHIYSSRGELIYGGTIDKSGSMELNLELIPGIYHVELNDGQNAGFQKLMITQ